MNNFKCFKRDVRSIGNVWNGEDIYFSQMRDGYSAKYQPNYPKSCIYDMIIQTLEGTSANNRGNYELIIYDGDKYISKYFESIDEIKQYFA